MAHRGGKRGRPARLGRSMAAPPPLSSIAAAPPPLGSTVAPPPLGSTAAPPPLGSTAAPPPLGSNTAAPPPLSSTTAPPPLGSNTAAPPPPLSSTTALPPLGPTTAAPPPFSSTPSMGRSTTVPPVLTRPTSMSQSSTQSISAPPPLPNGPSQAQSASSSGFTHSASSGADACSSTMNMMSAPIQIEPIANKSLHPGYKTSEVMTNIFKERLDVGGYTWKKVSQATKDFYWREFQKHFVYDETIEGPIKVCWLHQVAEQYAEFMSRLRHCTKKPAYVSQSTWDNLWTLWDTPEFRYKRQKMSENRSEVGGRGSGMSLHTAGSRSADSHARALALALGRKPTKFEVFKVMHRDKKNNKWVDQRSERVALEVGARIADNLDLSDESPLDESQRLEKIDEHYVECAGTTQQSIYGVGNYGSLMSSYQREIERAREEGRAEGRAEIQNKLDEVLARQNETDEQVRFLMQQFNNRNLG